MKRIFLLAFLNPALICAQEAPPIIIAEVKFCKWHNPINTSFVEECRVEQLVPDQNSTNNIIGCLRAVSMGAGYFWFEGSWWDIKGGTCKEMPNDYAMWRKEHDKRLANPEARK